MDDIDSLTEKSDTTDLDLCLIYVTTRVMRTGSDALTLKVYCHLFWRRCGGKKKKRLYKNYMENKEHLCD